MKKILFQRDMKKTEKNPSYGFKIVVLQESLLRCLVEIIKSKFTSGLKIHNKYPLHSPIDSRIWFSLKFLISVKVESLDLNVPSFYSFFLSKQTQKEMFEIGMNRNFANFIFTRKTT